MSVSGRVDQIQSVGSLKISCTNVESKDTFSSKSDCIVFVDEMRFYELNPAFKLIGQTEIHKSKNPDFKNSVSFNFSVGANIKLRFRLCDADDHGKKFQDIYSGEIYVADLLKANGRYVFKWPNSKGKESTMTVQYDTTTGNHDVFNAKIVCKKLPDVQVIGTIDPFLVFFRLMEDGKTLIQTCKTKAFKNNQNPVWDDFEQTIGTLCNGTLVNPIHIHLMDSQNSGNHKFVASCETTVEDIIARGSGGDEYTLTFKNDKKQDSGTITFSKVVHTHKPSFADLIKDGKRRIVSYVAIDCTGSNGHPHDKASLHYAFSASGNEYQNAIKSVCNVAKHYSSNGKFDVVGFGGQPNKNLPLSHCFDFPVNEELSGEEQVLDAYNKGMKDVVLSGPTIASEIIEAVAERAQKSAEAKSADSKSNEYHLLFMFTDGKFNDIKKVQDLIVASSELPMSIIIVGIGAGDEQTGFSSMEVLDADKGPLEASNGDKAKRDMVQFVKYNDAKKLGPFGLAKMTMDEIPNQVVVQYMLFSNK